MRHAAYLATFFLAVPLLMLAAGCSSQSSSEGYPPGGEDSGTNTPKSGQEQTPDDEPDRTGDGRAHGKVVFEFFDSEMYTGFDGSHEFQLVGVLVQYDRSDTSEPEIPFYPAPTITVDDPTLAELRLIDKPTKTDPEFYPKGQWFSVMSKSAGTVKLTANYGRLAAASTIHITQYSPEQWQAGQKRYTAPENPSATRRPCTDCHKLVNSAAPLHSPYYQSWISDEDLVSGITTGMIRSSTLRLAGGHRWDLTTDEQDGIVAYLRSLNPLAR